MKIGAERSGPENQIYPGQEGNEIDVPGAGTPPSAWGLTKWASDPHFVLPRPARIY